MIRDRGMKKWTPFLLPEHKAELKKLKEESLKKEKPALNEQEWQLINETICEAMAENRALEFTYYKNEDFHTLEGHVHYLDTTNKELRIVDLVHKVHRLKMIDVVRVEIK